MFAGLSLEISIGNACHVDFNRRYVMAKAEIKKASYQWCETWINCRLCLWISEFMRDP